MLIVVNKTYNGKHGLFLQGHSYTLPEHLIGQIDADLQMRNPPEKFDYRKVDNPAEINMPGVRVRLAKPYKGKHGNLPAGKIVTISSGRLSAIIAEHKARKQDFDYELVKNEEKKEPQKQPPQTAVDTA